MRNGKAWEMLIRFIWKDCDLCGGDAFWLETTEQEASEHVFPLLNDDAVAASRDLAQGSEHLAEMMGQPGHTFCYLVSGEMTFIRPFKPAYPVQHLWNGYSPSVEINPVELRRLSEIKRLKAQQQVKPD